MPLASELVLRGTCGGLALVLTVAAPARSALEPVPPHVIETSRLGYSAVLHDEPRLSHEVALGLTYGLPLAILYGSQGLRASAGPSWDLPVLLVAFGSLSAGYVYVGEPARGVAVLAGEGAVVAATFGAVWALSRIPPVNPPQDPPFIDPGSVLVPVLALVVCEIFKAHDLRRVVDEKNRLGEVMVAD